MFLHANMFNYWRQTSRQSSSLTPLHLACPTRVYSPARNTAGTDGVFAVQCRRCGLREICMFTDDSIVYDQIHYSRVHGRTAATTWVLRESYSDNCTSPTCRTQRERNNRRHIELRTRLTRHTSRLDLRTPLASGHVPLGEALKQ